MCTQAGRPLCPGNITWRSLLVHCASAPPPPAAGKHTAGERTAKWASAVLRQQDGDAYRFAYLHESPVPREQARA